MDVQVWLWSMLLSVSIVGVLSVKCKIKFTRGLRGGIFIGLATGLILEGIQRYVWRPPFLGMLFLAVFFVLLFCVLIVFYRFYRDPDRRVPPQEDVILSPADGTIRYVERVKNGEIPFSTKGQRRFRLSELTKTDLLDGDVLLVGIEMGVLDVHVNRAPVGGRIVFQQHTQGKFLSLRKLESLLENERVTTVIENGRLRIGVIQIASRLVRRIFSYFGKGDRLGMGQRMGMIKFGSQVDLGIPNLDSLRIRVKPGDEVVAGVSVIAGFGSE